MNEKSNLAYNKREWLTAAFYLVKGENLYSLKRNQNFWKYSAWPEIHLYFQQHWG